MFVSNSFSHDLNENRVNVSIRENRVVSLTLYLNASTFLSLDDQHGVNSFEAIAKMTAISDAEFTLISSQLFEKIEKNIHVIVNKGSPLDLNWKRPDPSSLRTYFKNILMESVVHQTLRDGSHFHEKQLQLISFSVSPEAIGSLELKTTSDFFPLTVVVSRILQKTALSSSDVISFDFTQDH